MLVVDEGRDGASVSVFLMPYPTLDGGDVDLLDFFISRVNLCIRYIEAVRSGSATFGGSAE